MLFTSVQVTARRKTYSIGIAESSVCISRLQLGLHCNRQSGAKLKQTKFVCTACTFYSLINLFGIASTRTVANVIILI